MKMISSTSTTSTNGVIWMSLDGEFAVTEEDAFT
jgi:hypothetical protein